MHNFKEEQLVRHKTTGRVGRLEYLQPGETWDKDEFWAFLNVPGFGDMELDDPREVEAVPEPDISPKAIFAELDMPSGGFSQKLEITETGPNDDSSIYVVGTMSGLPISFVMRITEVWEGE